MATTPAGMLQPSANRWVEESADRTKQVQADATDLGGAATSTPPTAPATHPPVVAEETALQSWSVGSSYVSANNANSLRSSFISSLGSLACSNNLLEQPAGERVVAWLLFVPRRAHDRCAAFRLQTQPFESDHAGFVSSTQRPEKGSRSEWQLGARRQVRMRNNPFQRPAERRPPAARRKVQVDSPCVTMPQKGTSR